MAELERGRSFKSEGRRVNAVPPMHLGESAMLKNLWQEAQVQQKQEQQMMFDENEKERKLQQMLEKYQNVVRQTQKQQQTPNSPPTTVQSSSYEKRIVQDKSSHCTPQPSMSHSQPCLIAVGDRNDFSPTSSWHPQFPRCSSSEQDGSTIITHTKPLSNNQKLIQSLREENMHLKQQLENYKKKTARLQKLESAHERIEAEYETMMREKERQDNLEKSAFVQMDTQIRRLINENENLQEQMEQISLSGAPQSIEQITKLNMLVADLIPQNNDMKATLKRQSVEMQAQRATLEEQRTHIAMLETALSIAQERLTRKEKMIEEQAASAERIAYLQRLLHDALCDKQARDEVHAEERARLEMEITQLKMHINKDTVAIMGGIKKGSTRSCTESSDENVVKLKKAMHGKDERITHLEKNVMELQRKLHEETEKKNSALGAISDSLEAKIKRLEDEKTERDRRIAELTELVELREEQREEDDARRDLDRMEDIRRRIDERKRKQRQESATNCCSASDDHSRSPSSSMIPSSHLLFDSTSLLSDLSSGRLSTNGQTLSSHYTSRPSTLQYGLFHLEKRDDNGDSVWNV